MLSSDLYLKSQFVAHHHAGAVIWPAALGASETERLRGSKRAINAPSTIAMSRNEKSVAELNFEIQE